MKQFWLTLNNFVECKIWSLNFFKFLYNECKVGIILDRSEGRRACIYSNTLTGIPTLITFGPLIEKKYLATSILHEIGHSLDMAAKKHKYWSQCFKDKDKPFLGNRDDMTKLREKTAWKNAVTLSKKYNVPLDIDYAADCLDSYKAKYQYFENRRSKRSS